MLNKRSVKLGFFALLIAGVAVYSLAFTTGITSAQGPGGRANGAGGQGNQNSGQGYGQQNAGQGFGQQNGVGQGMQQRNQQRDSSCELCLPAAVPGEVPATVVEALGAGLMDEHNAYNTYQAIIDQLGAVRLFVNIQRAEANHIEALEFLFGRYGLELPEVAPLSDFPQFGALADACAAGVAAETANFQLYDRWIATVQDYPDMVKVFTSLRDASQYQHLPALERCAG